MNFLLVLGVISRVHGLNCPEARPSSTLYPYPDENKCIYIYESEFRKNWVDAEKECQQIREMGSYMYHGELVSIHSEAFNRWLYDKLTKNGQLIYQSYWIGMRSMCANCPLMWTDGSPLDYEDWQPGEPSSPSVENCVELHTFPTYHTEEHPGLWNDHGCKETFFPICEYYPNGNPNDGQDWPPEGGCPKGWSQFAGNCYIIPIDGNSISDGLKYKPYQKAQDDCHSLGPKSDLATITNRYHQAWLSAQMFLGNHHSRSYIGVTASSDDYYFHYSTGDRLQWTNWGPNRPNKEPKDQRCVVMEWHPSDSGERDLGQWDDGDCTTYRPYVCSMPVQSELPKRDLENFNDCPEGWRSYGPACFQVNTERKSYAAAKQFCDSQNASMKKGKVFLTAIRNDYENNFILSYFGSDEFNRQAPENIWIGLEPYVDPSGALQTKWADGSSLDFTKWAVNQPPGNYDSTLTAGVMDKYGFWSLFHDDIQYPFICKYDPHYQEIVDKHDYRGEMYHCEHHHGHGSSWTEVGEYCMHGYSTKAVWAVAEENCKSYSPTLGSHLVSIHNMQENTEVMHQMAKLTKDEVWLGMTRFSNLGWKWTDSSAVSFTKWENGSPNSTILGDPDCVAMNQVGSWIDIDCSKKKKAYVCSHKRVWSNCQQADIEKQQCGFDGITESQCSDVLGCCFNPQSVIQCFLPYGSPAKNHQDKSSSGGMTTAGAVFLTLFFFCIPPAGFLFYVRRYGTGSASGMNSFSNPNA